jgi:hypothetical protein
MRALTGLFSAIALVLVVGTGARADDWNKKTFFTFSGPVQIPGATLAAGTYTFKLADLSGNRHVVQVFDKSEKKIIATLMAIPDQRNQPSDTPIVVFSERPAGVPVAVKSWFYPGESIGNEFIYPKRQAMEIARRTHESVLASTSDSTKIEKTTEVARVNDAGDASASNTAAAPTTTTRETRSAGTSGQSPTTTAPSTTARTNTARTNTARAQRHELPRTASELPLAALLGALSLAAGFGFSRARRRHEDVAQLR